MISGIRCSARRRRSSADVGAAVAEFASCFARRRSKRDIVRDFSAVSLGVGLGSDGSEMSSVERSRECGCVEEVGCEGFDKIWSLIRLIFSFCACVWSPTWHLRSGKLVIAANANESGSFFADLYIFSTTFSNLSCNSLSMNDPECVHAYSIFTCDPDPVPVASNRKGPALCSTSLSGCLFLGRTSQIASSRWMSCWHTVLLFHSLVIAGVRSPSNTAFRGPLCA